MLPHGFILEAYAPVQKLRWLSRSIVPLEGHDFVNDILESIIECLRDRYSAQRALSDFVAEIQNGKFQYGYAILGKDVAECVREIGTVLYEQLKQVGAYRVDGVLQYYFHPVTIPSFNDVLLFRIYELPEYSAPRANEENDES